jgi:hypothetical protein
VEKYCFICRIRFDDFEKRTLWGGNPVHESCVHELERRALSEHYKQEADKLRIRQTREQYRRK